MSASEFSESMENYLEVILELERIHKVARVKDIADRMGINRGSVTGALKNLGDKGLVHYEPYSFITLTDDGRRVAEEITRRHAVLRDFLANVLGIDPDTADQTACRMEHAIDAQTVERLVCFIDYIRSRPGESGEWLRAFRAHCAAGDGNRAACGTNSLESGDN